MTQPSSLPLNMQPAVEGPSPYTTLVELTWREKRIEYWIRFGPQSYEHILDRHRRLVGFAPGTIFAFIRWAANDFGTVLSRIDIVRTVERGEPFQTLPFDALNLNDEEIKSIIAFMKTLTDTNVEKSY